MLLTGNTVEAVKQVCLVCMTYRIHNLFGKFNSACFCWNERQIKTTSWTKRVHACYHITTWPDLCVILNNLEVPWLCESNPKPWQNPRSSCNSFPISHLTHHHHHQCFCPYKEAVVPGTEVLSYCGFLCWCVWPLSAMLPTLCRTLPLFTVVNHKKWCSS